MANAKTSEANLPLVDDGLTEAVLQAEQRFITTHPKSKAQVEAAAQSMPGGNTRSVLYYSPFPLTFVKGEGSRLTDIDGITYVNLLGEYTAGIYGHSHPVIAEAITAALADGLNLTGHNLLESQLAAAVCKRFPSIDLVRFTNSGTEANLMAIGLAKAFTRRPKVLVFRGGYHGGVLSFFYPGSPLNAPHDYLLGEYNDVLGARKLFDAHGQDIAAVVVEPMLGSGGCIAGSSEFLSMLRDETKRTGSVLIFDEVMTSRLTPGGLQEKLGLHADLTTLGKYIGGGGSIGAFGGRAEIMSLFDPRRKDALQHAGTFNNNVISMAAGLAGLTQIYTPEAAEALNARGDSLRNALNALCRKRKVGLQFTGIGSLMCAHGTSSPVTTLADALASPPLVRDLLFLHLIEHGYYIAKRGFLAVSLAVTEEEIQGFVAAVDQFIDRYIDCLPVASAA